MIIIVSIILATMSSAQGKPSYSSSVYFEGPGLAPYEYIEYGPPKLELTPYSQVLSLPVPQVNAVPRLSPCVSPCVLEASAPLYQLPQTKVAYSAPIQKISVAPQQIQEPASYSYSYAVDAASGDRKAAREAGAGGAVRGRYALLQPDGYVREVVYTADDESGFNAVVKFLPEDKKLEMPVTTNKVEVKPTTPKQEVKQEAKEAHTEPPTPKETSTETLKETSTKPLKETSTKPLKETSTKPLKETSTKPLKESSEAEDTHSPNIEASMELTTDSSMEIEEHKRSPVVWSFDEIIRCAQAALQSDSGKQKPKKDNNKNALTYIVLPQLTGVNKPC